MDPGSVARSIGDIFLHEEFAQPRTKPTPPGPPPSVTLPVQDLEAKVGLYRDQSDDSVGRIFIRNGKLIASADDGNEFELTPIAPNRFVIVGTSVVADFVTPAYGKPQELHVTGAGPTPRVSQQIRPFTPSSAELRAFAGTYTSDEVDGTYTIVARDSGLLLQIPTRVDIRFEPVFTDAFRGKILGVVKFSRDRRGRVTAFTATAPSVRGLRFNRS